MKTKNLIILASFLFLFDFVSFAIPQDAEPPEVGMIKAVTGKVWLHRGDKKEAAKKDMELKKGDILEIDDQASATIVYFKGGKKEEYKSKALIEIGTDKINLF